jgi:MFS family permease
MNSELRSLLKNASFTRFLLARLLGITANQMLLVALAWHMYDLTKSAWDLGLVGLFQFVPALLFTLPAGQAVDRWHRGRIIAICTLLQAMVAMTIGGSLVWAWDSRELILGLSVLLGVTRAFQMPAQQALTPMLVPQKLLARAVALSSGLVQIGVIGGPALGGVLYAEGAIWVYATCVVLSLCASLLTSGVRYPHQPTHHKSTSWRQVLAGLDFVWHKKVLLGAVSLDMFAVLLGGATALLPIYAKDILHAGPQGLGLLRAAPAVGALTMSLILTRWPLKKKVGRTLFGAVALFGLATVCFGLSHQFWWSLLALAITGAADNISVVVRLTVMQMETPDEMRGRVAAVNSIFIGASNQLGEFESGSVAAYWGPEVSVITGGLGTMLIAALWWRMFPALAQRDSLKT